VILRLLFFSGRFRINESVLNAANALLLAGKKTCKVWGNGHIITFDDRAYDLRMPCSYTLASAGGENDHGGVTIQMTRSADNATTIEVQSVNITFSGFNTTVTLMKTSHGVQVKVVTSCGATKNV